MRKLYVRCGRCGKKVAVDDAARVQRSWLGRALHDEHDDALCPECSAALNEWFVI